MTERFNDSGRGSYTNRAQAQALVLVGRRELSVLDVIGLAGDQLDELRHIPLKALLAAETDDQTATRAMAMLNRNFGLPVTARVRDILWASRRTIFESYWANGNNLIRPMIPTGT